MRGHHPLPCRPTFQIWSTNPTGTRAATISVSSISRGWWSPSTAYVVQNVDQMSVQQLRAELTQRDVLYSAAKVDISGDVIALLDKKYREAK